jgi:hypothetical protein
MSNLFTAINPPPVANISSNLYMAGSAAKLYAESEIREAKEVIIFQQRQLLLAEEKIKKEFDEE